MNPYTTQVPPFSPPKISTVNLWIRIHVDERCRKIIWLKLKNVNNMGVEPKIGVPQNGWWK